jgi:Peptidase family M41
MDRTTLNDRRGIAFHEAGHAVVAWALDCQVKEIAIIGDGGETSTDCDYQRLCFRDRLALCLAGEVAEVLYDAPMQPRSAASDFGKIAQLLTGLDEDTSCKIRSLGRIRAEELLKEHTLIVERVAGYLMHKDRIDESTFVELVLGRV